MRDEHAHSFCRCVATRHKGLCNNYLEGGSKINGGGGLNLNQSAGWGGGVRCNFLNICRGGGGLEVKLRGLISIHGLKIMYITCKRIKINFWNLLF